MIASDVRDKKWLNEISEYKSAVILMEGISMYLKEAELIELFINIYLENDILIQTQQYHYLLLKDQNLYLNF